jgi:hypothetical protein
MTVSEFIVFKSAKQKENTNDSSDIRLQTEKDTSSILKTLLLRSKLHAIKTV